jgi:hypothetical protein
MLGRMASTAAFDRESAQRAAVAPQLLVRLRRGTLDRALADGIDPLRSPALALRARQLEAHEITGVAARMRSILRELDHPTPGFSAGVPIRRAQVAAARPFITNLVECLDTIEDPRAAGAARTRLLVTDGSSPVYAPSDPGALARLAWRAADAL